MQQHPNDLRYTKTHEWVKLENDGTVTIGITAHAAEQLGDLVFVDLPQTEAETAPGDEVCVVESVKAAADVYAPLSGEIIAVNEELTDNPGLVNTDPFGEGWLYKLKLQNQKDMEQLLEVEAYIQVAETE